MAFFRVSYSYLRLSVVGNRSEIIPVKRLMSSLMNFGILQSEMALSTKLDSSVSGNSFFSTPAARIIDFTARIP